MAAVNIAPAADTMRPRVFESRHTATKAARRLKLRIGWSRRARRARRRSRRAVGRRPWCRIARDVAAAVGLPGGWCAPGARRGAGGGPRAAAGGRFKSEDRGGPLLSRGRSTMRPVTDSERLAYHDAVLRAARRYSMALDRGEVLVTTMAYVELVRASVAAERAGTWPLPERLRPRLASGPD